MIRKVNIGEQILPVELVGRRPALALRIGQGLLTVLEHSHVAADAPGFDGAFELTVDGLTYRGWRYRMGREVHVRVGGRTFVVGLREAGSGLGAEEESQTELRAQMPGVVVGIHCQAGQAVAKGDPLLTVESMKLQATLVAAREAVIEKVHVGAESAFERGVVLVSFAATAGGAGGAVSAASGAGVAGAVSAATGAGVADTVSAASGAGVAVAGGVR